MKYLYFFYYFIMFFLMCFLSCTGLSCQAGDKHVLAAETTSSYYLEQYGITWYFETPITYGMFANGDYWVQGPITIVGVSPFFDGEKNGLEINPVSSTQQSYDTRISGFDSSALPSFPIYATPGQSIIKSVGLQDSGNHSVIETASVITIVSSPPPGNGANVFRPPFCGDEKPYINVNDVRTDLLPSLQKPFAAGDIPTLEWVEERYQRVQLDHKQRMVGREVYSSENCDWHGYGLDSGEDNMKAALRLMLNDPLADKMPALINYVQYIIDIYYAVLNGQTWPGGGGHVAGKKLPLCLGAYLLDDEDMKQTVRNLNPFEYENIYYSEAAGMILWGDNEGSRTEKLYWSRLLNSSGEKGVRDPYGYIDGGWMFQKDNGKWVVANYQAHVSSVFKAEVLCMIIIPSLQSIWGNPENLINYVYRWVTFGYHTQPDPCAPHDGNWNHYGITYGPDGEGGYIEDTYHGDGIGRFPGVHGTNADGGNHSNKFLKAMWDNVINQ